MLCSITERTQTFVISVTLRVVTDSLFKDSIFFKVNFIDCLSSWVVNVDNLCRFGDAVVFFVDELNENFALLVCYENILLCHLIIISAEVALLVLIISKFRYKLLFILFI